MVKVTSVSCCVIHLCLHLGELAIVFIVLLLRKWSDMNSETSEMLRAQTVYICSVVCVVVAQVLLLQKRVAEERCWRAD